MYNIISTMFVNFNFQACITLILSTTCICEIPFGVNVSTPDTKKKRGI